MVKLMMVSRSSDILEALCRAKKQWGIFFNGTAPELGRNYEKDSKNVKKSAPWLARLTYEDRMAALCEGSGYLFFNTKKEMEKVYDETVSDDYPRKGLPSIYMLTCDPHGNLLTENT